MSLFKKNKKIDGLDKPMKDGAESRAKKLEDVLALQKRHPFLDRFLMLAGIAAIIIVAIPFIYISFELSVFNMIGGGFDRFMNGTETSTGILELFKSAGSGMVPIFQIPWSNASWLFALIGTVLLILIVVCLGYLLVIYIRDFVTIIKGIMLMLSKNTESLGALVKGQVDDAKVIATSETTSAKKGKKKVKKNEPVTESPKSEPLNFTDTDEDLEKMVEKAKKDIQAEKNTSVIDYSKLSDDELNSLLGKK